MNTCVEVSGFSLFSPVLSVGCYSNKVPPCVWLMYGHWSVCPGPAPAIHHRTSGHEWMGTRVCSSSLPSNLCISISKYLNIWQSDYSAATCALLSTDIISRAKGPLLSQTLPPIIPDILRCRVEDQERRGYTQEGQTCVYNPLKIFNILQCAYLYHIEHEKLLTTPQWNKDGRRKTSHFFSCI